MRRKLYVAMAAALAASAIAGCSGSSSSTPASSSEPSSEVKTEEASSENAESSSEEGSSETESTPEQPSDEPHTSKNGVESWDDGVVRKDLTASELSILMGNGINLGNTMEAVDTSLGYGLTSDWYETAWGQPVTTQEMFHAMKEAGFDTVRIPVAWVSDAMPGFKDVKDKIKEYLNGNTDTIDLSDGDYTIDSSYLCRVEEIANYAIEEGMYVIINDHWDGGWYGMFGSATPEISDCAMDIYTSMWTQIAEHFSEYGDHILFSAANEEIGSRLNDKDIAADSGTLSKEEYYAKANEINQKFVDTVRATGGNNAERFLVAQGINTNIDNTCDDMFKMPTDSADKKLFLDVHYYDPWNFCGDSTTVELWGTKSEVEYMNETLAKLTKFTDEGYGVIIGEWGVLFDYNKREQRKSTVDYVKNFLDNCDEYNLVSCLWDTGAQFNRQECTMRNADTAAIFAERAYDKQKDLSQEDIIKAAQDNKAAFLEQAPVSFVETDFDPDDDAVATAWIMWNSGDWSLSYSVGDKYNPSDISSGIVPETAIVGGEGFYTVSLDFTDAGESNGTVFSAIGIYNAEKLFPGYAMVITSLKINGEEYEMTSKPYTTSDDKNTTRINLYNGWVGSIPDEARVVDGDLAPCAPEGILDPNVKVTTIEITFDYVAPEHFEEYTTDRDTWAAKELK